MTNLLKNKYNNALELIEETGKIPMRCIDDGEFEQLKNEIENLGYKCKLDSSTDYLLVEKMTRSEMIKNLKKEIGSMTLDSKELEEIMPLVHEYLLEKFRGFVNDPHNTATEEELEAFQNGECLIDIYFLPDKVTYTVWVDSRQLANEPDWAEDSWDDILTEELAALLKVAKQG